MQMPMHFLTTGTFLYLLSSFCLLQLSAMGLSSSTPKVKAASASSNANVNANVNANINANVNVNAIPPPIVYTIAGSDSGGGAGIQADLHAIQSMGCHGCSAITCLTAQSSTGVTGVHSPPVDFLKLQLDTLMKDMPPRAIKIGMLGTKELALEVGKFLKHLRDGTDENDNKTHQEPPLVVLDPVMISTSGHKLIQDDAKQAIIQSVFPYVDVVTPNKFEAEELLGRTLHTPEDIEQGAREIINMGTKSVLIKGGHSLAERQDEEDIDLSRLMSMLPLDMHKIISFPPMDH